VPELPGSLASLERWMQALLTHPAGPRAGAVSPEARAALRAEIPDVFLPSRELSSEARVGVYAEMYFARLIEVLEEEFPALVRLLGHERAHALFRAYLIAHPSRHYSLNVLGRALEGFVRDECGALDLESRAFAVELVRLERVLQDVFDAPASETLAADALAALPPERWANARLVPIPAFRLLAFEYPTNAWYQAFRDASSSDGSGDAAPRPVPPREPSWTALFRQDGRVWRMDLSRAQHALLAALAAGQALEPALATLARDGFALNELAPELQGWFRTWAAEGFFARVELG
jgi:hypothetical protein